ncbi:hypothetical protein [Streptomyces daghestanicus]|uniref:Uncharacterized protein n=1 Tax=Streptomyces daghestanicus TaxID=66885 RepID=A0ABQ3Q8C9_9ACTN|nr:hypothetical protein [Streptomyces daghestanicus]GGU58029.1 hypothetical protein GCM10010259_56230 [Streptomyces daghestanicus]GHI33504.1 hypothetical protein Sdagh_52340 [Streptomyces daghestanicus]
MSYSSAGNLVAGDTNGSTDEFEFDVRTGVTTRVSVAGGGSQADMGVLPGFQQPPAVSDDGREAVFSSNSTNLVAGAGSASGSAV